MTRERFVLVSKVSIHGSLRRTGFARWKLLVVYVSNNQGQHPHERHYSAHDPQIDISFGEGSNTFPSQEGLKKDNTSAANTGTEV
jgi:hypothetical protein